MRVSPDAVVPTLVDGDLALVESSLIAEGLDKTYNQSRFMPKVAGRETRVRHWLPAVPGGACGDQYAVVLHLHARQGHRDEIPEEIEAGIAGMPDPIQRNKRRNLFAHGLKSDHAEQAWRHLHRAFGHMSTDTGEGDWVSGPEFGLADIGPVSYVDRLDRPGFTGHWTEAFPVVGNRRDRIRARPSFDTAIEAFMPAAMAQSRRAGRAKHWPVLHENWADIRSTMGRVAT